MCGVVGYIGKNDAVPVLINGLSKLEYRGYDSAGVAVYDSKQDKINICKTKGRIQNLQDKLYMSPLNGKVGIGHTRWATHGVPSDRNAHPHFSDDSKIAVVHNGIIENYMSLKEELEEKGYKFASETDTETVAHLIDYYYKSGMDILDAVFEVLDRIEGSYALGILCKDFPDQLIATRKDSPLVVGLGEGENFIASDMPAILNYTRDVYLIDDNQVAVLTADSVKILDLDKNEVKKDIFKVDWDIEAAEKSGYDHFMLKEIHEQPKVVRDNLNSRLKESGVELDSIKLGKEELKNINRIYIVACGTAYYAGLTLPYIAYCFVKKFFLSNNTDDKGRLLNKGNRPVFKLSRGIRLAMKISYFL